MPLPFLRWPLSTQFPRMLRQLEQDVETVIDVLQPGPIGILEQKFSAVEVERAKSTVCRAVDTWRKNAALERTSRVQEHPTD